MALVRRLYRGCKVWVEEAEPGDPGPAPGLAKIRYQPEGPAYSARWSEISEIPKGQAPAEESAATPPRSSSASEERAPRAPGSKAGRSAGRAGAPAGTRRKTVGRRDSASPAAPSAAIVIYCDGSCFGNPGPAGVGVLLEWKGRTREFSKVLGDGTNNIAELTAIEVALQQVKNRKLPVRVHTDSAYAIGVLQEGWKAKENRELVARVQQLMREFPDLKLCKVRGHSGDERNERVDRLARDAIARGS
jgi:ribonuclease HI